MKYDIFISYSTKDKAQVLSVVDALRVQGYKIWIDKEGIRSGDPSFKSTLVDAIENSKVVLFFSSCNSNTSTWTEKEIGIAQKRKKHIIPIRLDYSNYAKSVEFDLVNSDYIDYGNTTKAKLEEEKLFSSLEGIIGKKNKTKERHVDVNKRILHLADSYRKGLGVPRDYEFAATLYDKAAKQGNPIAQCNLATMYLKGLGRKVDMALAATLYKMAAEGGSALATFKLGQMYFKGEFVEQNFNKAMLLYEQAASMGCQLAKDELANIRR